jgi:hypothetical protein
VQQLPAARHLRVAATVLNALPWFELIPDALPDPRRADTHRLVVAGSGLFYPYPGLPDTTAATTPAPAGRVLPSPGSDYIVSAATPDRSVLLAYVPPGSAPGRSFEVDLSQKTPRPLLAVWVDPTTGEAFPINTLRAGRQVLTTPGLNHDGQTDWLLLVRPR